MPNSNRLVKDNDKETSETLEDELETKLNFTEQTTKPNTNVIYFETNDNSVEYVNYQDERQMPDIMRLIQKDLSEPYSIYTYRYFIHNWPQLCFLVCDHLLIRFFSTLQFYCIFIRAWMMENV